MLIGAAMYVDALNLTFILSISLQNEKPNIVGGIQYLLKSIKSLNGIAEQDPLTWPTVKLICSSIEDENGYKLNEGANHNHIIHKMYADSALADVKQLEVRMKTRLEWSDLEMLRAILVFLDTKSWSTSPSVDTMVTSENTDDLEEIRKAVEYITSQFRQPFEAKGIDLTSIEDQVEKSVEIS